MIFYAIFYLNVSFSKLTSSLETIKSTLNILREGSEERDDGGGLRIVEGKTRDSTLEGLKLLVTLLELVVPGKIYCLNCSLQVNCFFNHYFLFLKKRKKKINK